MSRFCEKKYKQAEQIEIWRLVVERRKDKTMREMHNLGKRNNDAETTIEEDLVWWSCANLWSWMVKKVNEFDDAETWLVYNDLKFHDRVPEYISGSYSGSVTMPMLRTNTAKGMEYLMVEYLVKK